MPSAFALTCTGSAESSQHAHQDTLRLLQSPRAAQKLCHRLALVLTQREMLPPSAAAELRALPGSPCAVALGLAGDDSGWLQHLALMQQGGVSAAPLKPGGQLAAGTAAWKAFNSNRTLVWRASERRWAAAAEPWCNGGCST